MSRKSKQEELRARAFGSVTVTDAEASNDMVGCGVCEGVELDLGELIAKARGADTELIPPLAPVYNTRLHFNHVDYDDSELGHEFKVLGSFFLFFFWYLP